MMKFTTNGLGLLTALISLSCASAASVNLCGDYTDSFTVEAGDANTLGCQAFVKAGATITIEAGATISVSLQFRKWPRRNFSSYRPAVFVPIIPLTNTHAH